MGITVHPWDDSPFLLEIGVNCGAIGTTHWHTNCIHNITLVVHSPMANGIDVSLSAYPDADLIVPFTVEYDGVEVLCIRKMEYFPAPYVGIFLGGDIFLME